MITTFNLTTREYGLKEFSVVWTFVLIAPLVYFPGASVLVGHPWKAELILSFILFALLIGSLLFRQTHCFSALKSSQIFIYTVAPCLAFIIWSAMSAFWADSASSVIHHTLVWACYLTFFLFALQIVSDRKLFKISLISLGAVLSVICLCCIFEFVFEENIGETFGSRYGRYAEIFAAVLPLFFSFVLRLKKRHFWWAAMTTLFLWLGLLFAMSRSSLFASIVGLTTFIFLRIFSEKTFVEKKRLIFAPLGLVLVALLIQIPFSSNNEAQKGSTFSRIKIEDEKDASNSLSQNVRFLFAGVGKEMFLDNRLFGVGADNFGLEFNKYRAVFSANPQNKSIARQQEEYIPERAHNEYLQIAAELGVVGGIIFLCFIAGIVKSGFSEVVKNRFARGGILTHAAVGGIIAFLMTSMFSSYSFRLMQNGLIFFFLLAILLRNIAVEKEREEKTSFSLFPQAKIVFAAIALFACLSLTIFSTLKAASQYFVYQAERQKDFETAQSFYKSAIRFDSANASANFLFGLRLLDEGKYDESAAQLRQAVNKGINDSVSYSYLISAQTLANQPQQALNTTAEAVEIFPYSVFLRVRYAALLDKFQREIDSAKQMEIAEQLDNKQAKTWRLLINEGSLKASEKARADKKISDLDSLTPQLGVYAVLAERQILHPEEKPQFVF